MTPNANAQIITSGTFPEFTVGTVSATISDEVVVNDDMLEDPNGPIKAIVWSKLLAPHGVPPYSSTGGFYIEDYNGNFYQPTTGAFSKDFDVAIGNSPGTGGNAIDYQLVVVYFNHDPITSANTTMLDIYDIVNVGTPSLSLTLRSGFPELLSTAFVSSNGYPHIDMWSDANNLVGGFPSMHEFAVVWAEDITGNLGFFGTDVTAALSTFPAIIGTNAYMPDVAAFTDVKTGDKKVEIAYGRGVGSAITNSFSSGLSIAEYNFSNPSSTPTPITPGTLLDPSGLYAPRIEAMSQYDQTKNLVKWQIAASISTGSPSATQVLGYNDKTVGFTDMSSILSPLYPFAVWTPQVYAAMGACVAAGIGPSISSTNIGNQQYTVGFYPWQHDSLYARHIGVSTGTLINPVQCYQVNDNGPAGDVNYNWDLDQSFALTNASNTGKDILSAWCNGMFIEAKYSNPNVMAFRSIPLSGLPLHGKVGDVFLYPQPGTNILNVENGKTGDVYQAVDLNGKNVANGQLNESAQIDISSMSSGVYLLYINGKSLKFTKK